MTAPALDIADLTADREALARACPADLYVAGSVTRFPDERDRFQLMFHKSTHVVRCLVLGNGAGKTTVAGVEVDWWIQQNHPYQETPKGEHIQVIWICQKFQAFDELRPQLEARCFTRGWSWNDNDHRYTWPGKGTMTVFSDEGDWENAQGIPADLVVIDEECNPKLWTELRMRRRGDKKTRYVISATATQGKRWMHSDLYVPWQEHHDALGLTEDQAMREQSNPDYWVWPKGGLRDNPAMTDEDWEWYKKSLRNKHPSEQKARLYGGFHDFNAAAVFDLDALDEVEQEMGTPGKLGVQGALVNEDGRPIDMLKMGAEWFATADLPMARRRFTFEPTGGTWEGGRLTIFEQPRATDLYVMGMDFAQGLQTGDFDTAIVCRDEGERLVQVAEAQGRWGTSTAPILFYMLGMYFNEALAVGEANSMGLGNLRLMYQLGYVYQYLREAKPDAKASPKSDRLGYWKGSPLPIQRLQRVIAPRKVGQVLRNPSALVVRSNALLDELRRYEYRPRSSAAEITETRDKDLVMGAERGYHDDLVSAAAGCVLGWVELPKFERPEPVYPHGSLGQRLGHKDVLRPAGKTGPYAFAKR